MEVGRRFQPLEYGDGLELAAKLFLRTREPGKHLTPFYEKARPHTSLIR